MIHNSNPVCRVQSSETLENSENKGQLCDENPKSQRFVLIISKKCLSAIHTRNIGYFEEIPHSKSWA